MEKRARLEWVDIAKGIAIILMVIGHEVPKVQSQHIYALIFSFHMPLFFVLSGFTSRPVETWERFWVKAKKTFIHVWLLAVLMIILLGFESLLFLNGYSITSFYQSIIRGIYWGSNISAIGLMSVGVMWFLFVFFWAKLIFDALQVVLSDIYIGIVLFIASGISMFYCQNFAHYLPQALDIVPIAAFFMWAGAVARKATGNNLIMAKKNVLYSVLIIFWVICFALNIYIELSIRYYPLTYVSIVEALGGTLAVSLLSKWLTPLKLSSLLQLVGKHTLAVLCIHHLDLFWVNWGNYIHWWPLAAVLRLIIDLVILAIVLLVQRFMKKKGKLAK